MKKNKKKKRVKPLELILTVIPLVLFIFFILSLFHNWANSLAIKLHFCNHTACMIFSIIWLIFALIGVYYLFSKNKMSFLWIIAYIVVLIVGIILMNIIYCDTDGKMHFSGDGLLGGLLGVQKPLNGDSSPPGSSYKVEELPCSDSDRGQDYEIRGWITPITPSVSDFCLDNETLREMYCDSDITYTSEDISCIDEFGIEYVCDEGRCVVGEADDDENGEVETETDCGDGIDNDDDQLIDCEDPDCQIPIEDGGCGDFEYSCQHISDFPSCGGTCPPGEECISYIYADSTLDASWCECMPVGETFCGEYEAPFCTGWCLDSDECISDQGGCFCNFDYGYCVETDDPYDFYEFGMCTGVDGLTWKDYCDGEVLHEFSCNGDECIEIIQKCSELGMYCVGGACQVEPPEY